MRFTSGILFCGAALGVAGCSIHPLPKDIGDPTPAIVQKIRCEVQSAVFDQVIALLLWKKAGIDPATGRKIRATGPNETGFSKDTNEIGEYLKNNREHIKYLDPKGLPRVIRNDKEKVIATIPAHIAEKRLDPEAADLISAHTETLIAYKFTFTVTESNDAKAGANFKLPFSTMGAFTLGITAGSERERLSERIVDVADKFSSFRDLKCRNKDIVKNKNWIYPINGRIGIDEVIDSYVKLHWQVDRKGGGSFTSLTDKLTFTTKIFATANPKIVLNPASRDRFKLANADINLNADRTDMHEVQFTIKPPVKSPKETDFDTVPLVPGTVFLKFKRPKSRTVKPPKISTLGERTRKSFFRSPNAKDRADMRDAQRLLEGTIGLSRERTLRELIDKKRTDGR